MAHALLAIVLKASLLMCMGAVVSLALVRSSAAARHLAWVSALMLALLLPLASALVPSYAVMEDPWAVSAVTAAATQPAAGSAWPDLLWPSLVAVWVLGALLFLLRDLLDRAGLTRFSRHAQPLSSPQWAAALQRFERSGALRVLETDRVAGPCTWGFFKPTLVLPRATEHWSEAERRYALTHELAHIERRDYISAQIVRLACAVHWYNPLVWYAARQAHKLQEQACDDAVLRNGAVPSDYAQLLVGIARTCCGSPRVAMGMAERSPLYDRVRAILDPRKARAAQSRTGALATILPLACAMALIAGAGLAEPEIARAAERTVRAAEPAAVPAEPVAAAVATAGTPAKAAHHARAATPATHEDETETPALDPLEQVPPVPPVPPLPRVQPLPPIPPLPPLPSQ